MATNGENSMPEGISRRRATTKVTIMAEHADSVLTTATVDADRHAFVRPYMISPYTIGDGSASPFRYCHIEVFLVDEGWKVFSEYYAGSYRPHYW